MSFQQVINLYKNSPELFFKEILGEKTEKEWKLYWESNEGKQYIDFFRRIQTYIIKNKVSTKISLIIGSYNSSTNLFKTSYNSPRDYFIIKDSDFSIFNSIKMNEKEASRVEKIMNRKYGNSIILYMNYDVLDLENDKIIISDISIDFVEEASNSLICTIPLSNDQKLSNQIVSSNIVIDNTVKGNFSYNEIPFGATYEEIKNLFLDNNLKISEYNKREFQLNKVFNLEIMPALCEPYYNWSTGGVAGTPYKYESQQIGSNTFNYIKILSIYDEKYWDNISSVTFYFVDTGNGVYKLFLYQKDFKSENFTNNEFSIVLENQSKQISSKLKKNYKNKEMKQYQKNSDKINWVAICYSWEDKKNKIFFIGDTWISDRECSTYKELYYYDTSFEEIAKIQKQKYIEQKEQEELKKSQEKINNSTLDF